MGILDMFLSKRETYNTSDVCKILLAVGTGSSYAEDDFAETHNKMIEVFCKTMTDPGILNLIYYELITVRLLTFYLACRNGRYIAAVKEAGTLDYQFDTMVKNHFFSIQDHFEVDLTSMYEYRKSSYNTAYNVGKSNAYTAVGNVFNEYLLNSLNNRPLLCTVSSDVEAEKPWNKELFALPEYRASQQGYIFCYALTKHMIERADAIFSSKVCIIIK